MESDGKLYFNENEGDSVWKDHMERITYEENVWYHNVERNSIEAVCASRDEAVRSLDEMKAGKALGPSDVSLDLIAASMEVGFQVMVELCQSSGGIWNVS